MLFMRYAHLAELIYDSDVRWYLQLHIHDSFALFSTKITLYQHRTSLCFIEASISSQRITKGKNCSHIPSVVPHEQSVSSHSRHESGVHTLAKVDVRITCLFANGDLTRSSNKHKGEDVTNTFVLTAEIPSIDEKRPRAFDRPTSEEVSNVNSVLACSIVMASSQLTAKKAGNNKENIKVNQIFCNN
ncbi:hypothetical protein Adt_06195 [Abeliophyllum distichum]|uniref:Uncharacterized protein n=1 Tax=Abeliophyllum distichum TaxID=126358 RepID=A0ABD1V671_9LAMI